MRTYREPPFVEPLTAHFVYAAWSVDPRRVGPFVRRSAARAEWIEEVRRVAGRLGRHADVRVFETSFMPPLPGMPRYDVVLLARAENGQAATALRDDPQLRALTPVALFTATNAARFGDTEAATSGVDILLNHFTGPPDQAAAVTTWRRISAWYAAKTAVDNSTLLRPDDGAPYVVVNYARIRGGVVVFMLQQLLRPSFHRYVRGLLEDHGLTALPLFVRPIPVDVTGA